MPYPFKFPERDCQWCGASFHPKMRDRVTYCSRACYYKSRAYDRMRTRLDDLKAFFANAFKPTTCAQCAKVFRPRKARPFCGAKCKRETVCRLGREAYRAANPPVREKPCFKCGAVTTAASNGPTSCAPCKRAAKKKWHKKYKWIRKARERGARAERFAPHDVFDRDGWRCQLCGVKTSTEHATTHDRYPNLDHIVPLAKGGEHTRENTQCACRRCNLSKGDALLPFQTRLLA
jgi:5-methylcytosine-specific restriction endonuclease McrA